MEKSNDSASPLDVDVRHAPTLEDFCDAANDLYAAPTEERFLAVVNLARESLILRGRAWQEGYDFARSAAGWNEHVDPATEGLYVVRDSTGNVEVGMWYAKTFNGQLAEWSKEFRDVDRDGIVAWIKVPNAS